jgi:hypothetical protein
MSASCCLVFFGVRLPIPPNEVESVERRIDPRMKRAQANGLQCYWSDFGSEGSRYYLFIGKQLGVFGVENRSELQLSIADINQLAGETSTRLTQAGFADEPVLYVQWEEDH